MVYRMNISQVKNFRRDVCRTLGHDWVPYQWEAENGEVCSRCKKRVLRFVFSKPTFFGKLPVRVDVNVLPADGMDGKTTWDITWEE